MNNGKQNARSGSGIWFRHKNPRNLAIRVPGVAQSNQVGKLVAIIAAAKATPPYQPLKIVTNSKYAIYGLTDHLESWENDGWINIENAILFKKAAHALRHQSARTTFQWTKGHNGTIGNEESDHLAKQGANKQEINALELDILIEFDIQGAKLSMLTQAKAYRGILERKEVEPRNSTEINLQLTCNAVGRLTGKIETNATIWNNLWKPTIRPLIQQFIYKSIHNTYKVGELWRHIPRFEEREHCSTCNITESMDHILTKCKNPSTQLVWSLAQDLWPYDNTPWQAPNLGSILGCGCINLRPRTRQRNENEPDKRSILQGPTHLLQILLSESAYLIWVLRCKRVIQGIQHSRSETEGRWLCVINARLTTDKITATKIKRDKGFTNLVVNTWEQALEKRRGLPPNWIHYNEALVGRTAPRTRNTGERVF